MESIKKIKEKPDAVPIASTSDQTSGSTVTADDTAAIGLQHSASPSGASGHTSGESNRDPTPAPQQSVSNSATTSSAHCGAGRDLVSGDESSDKDSDCTLVSDNASLCSEKSGLTAIGEEINRLQLHAKTGFVKLTNTERKRFKKALASGLSRDKALEAALMNQRKKPEVKRVRSEEKSPEQPATKRSKTTHVGSIKPSFSQVAGSIRLGLTSADVINRPLTSEQMAQIQEAIIDVTIEHADRDVRPEFEGCVPRTGWLLLVCSNAQTADWVRRSFVHIRAKCALDIVLVEEGQFPRTHVIRGYFPQSISLSNEKVLASIGAQNPLKTAQWKVVQRLTHGQLLHLVIIVDNASMTTLTGLKGRIAYRFGHIRLILKDPAASKPAADDGKQADEGQAGIKEQGSVDPPAPGGVDVGTANEGAAEGSSAIGTAGPSAGHTVGRSDGGNTGATPTTVTTGSLPTKSGEAAKGANPRPTSKAPLTAKKGGSKGSRGAKAAKLISQSLSNNTP